jgi:outer membrane protein assembly factor BamB
MMSNTHSARAIVAAVGVAVAVVLVAVLIAPPQVVSVAGAAEQQAKAGTGWPMFGGSPGRNMVNLAEKNLPDDWDIQSKKNVKWTAKLGSRAYAMVVAGGKVFVGTNNEAPRNPRDTRKRMDGKTEPVDKSVLMCFDEATGDLLWQHVNDKLPSGQVNDWEHEGICSTPAVDGNRLYYVSNRCEVVCLDVNGFKDGNQGVTDEKYKEPTDADVIWRLDMMKELNVFPHNLAASSPLVVGDMVFVITSNGVDAGHVNIPAPDAPSFIAVDKNTGKLVWKDNSPGRHIMHGQWASPSYAEVGGRAQVIFPGGDGWIYSFEPKTGKLLWKFDGNPKDARYELGGRGTKSDFIASPVVFNGKVYIANGQDPEHYEGVGHLWCIDPTKSGDISPEIVTAGKTEKNPNSGLVWHFGGPEKNPMAAGREYVFGRTISSVAIHDGALYAAELSGYLYCLNPDNGQKYWVHDLKAGVWGSPLWVDGKVYLGTEDGDVWVFKHDKQKAQSKKIDVGGPIRSSVVAADGTLFVMTESHLYAIAAKK